jgi:hypothetical protein
LRPPPPKLGVTHWSSRLLAGQLGISFSAVAKAWREYGIQPWRAETFKFRTDLQLVAKVSDTNPSFYLRKYRLPCRFAPSRSDSFPLVTCGFVLGS